MAQMEAHGQPEKCTTPEPDHLTIGPLYPSGSALLYGNADVLA